MVLVFHLTITQSPARHQCEEDDILVLSNRLLVCKNVHGNDKVLARPNTRPSGNVGQSHETVHWVLRPVYCQYMMVPSVWSLYVKLRTSRMTLPQTYFLQTTFGVQASG